jgi:flagellar biogenesis protein FliO
MTEIIREKIFTATPQKKEATNVQTVEYLIYFFFGVLEIILAFRLFLKLFGASLSSGFVRGVYTIAGIFILPFEGIFRRGYAPGVETTAVLEPSTIVALLFYIILAWGIVKLIKISSGEKQKS